MVKKTKKKAFKSFETEEVVKSKPLAKKKKTSISFDAYFSHLLIGGETILAHHKAAMRKFAESKGLTGDATKDEFDRVFNTY